MFSFPLPLLPIKSNFKYMKSLSYLDCAKNKISLLQIETCIFR